MDEFLELLSHGIATNQKLAQSFEAYLVTLAKYHAIYTKKAKIFLKKNYAIGRLAFAKEGYGFVMSCFCKQDWLVEKYRLKGAQNGDLVLAQKINSGPSKRPKAKIISIIESKHQCVLAYLEKYQSQVLAIGIPHEKTYKIKASQKSLKTLPMGTIVKLHPEDGEIIEILGALHDPSIDEVISLHLYDKKESFSLQAEVQAKQYKSPLASQHKERINLCSLPFCTIDPIGAKDHDDAIYYDKQQALLYVAIADVSYYVKSDSALDRDAKQRGFSLYFPHKSIPMLPFELSQNLCSLKEGKTRLAMVWKMRLHKRSFQVLHAQLFEALIKVKQQLSYEEVDRLFAQQKTRIKPILRPMLLALSEVTKKIRKKRLQQGYDFLGDEYLLLLDENLELQSSHQAHHTLSHQLIEECMLLANCLSASLLEQKNSLPDEQLKLGIYRVHPKPKKENLRELFGELALLGLWDKKGPPKTWEALHKAIIQIQNASKKANLAQEVDKLIIQSMPKASYASHNIGHFGLGFGLYSHFTSPIRRYADLVLHRLLKAKITIQEDEQNKQGLPLLCQQINQLERDGMKVELDFKDRKFARFARANLGLVCEGVVIQDSPLLVRLLSAPLFGARVICLKGHARKYQKVRVQILEVNLALPKIYGHIKSNPKRAQYWRGHV